MSFPIKEFAIQNWIGGTFGGTLCTKSRAHCLKSSTSRGQSTNLQIQQEDEISTEMLEERERAIRQLEVGILDFCVKFYNDSCYKNIQLKNLMSCYVYFAVSGLQIVFLVERTNLRPKQKVVGHVALLPFWSVKVLKVC